MKTREVLFLSKKNVSVKKYIWQIEQTVDMVGKRPTYIKNKIVS